VQEGGGMSYRTTTKRMSTYTLPPPMLDAKTAHAVAGFLHWTVVALMRLHREWGPFDGLHNVSNAAHQALSFGEKGSNVPEFGGEREPTWGGP
jgi:hypothetical protein